MDYRYSSRSFEILDKACPELQLIFTSALNLNLMDITILESYRDEAKQNRLFDIGHSKVKFPDSKHNVYPSMAIDAVPYIDGTISFDCKHCTYLAGIITSIARICEVNIRWGGNWDMDGEPITDQHFQDLVHYEVI